MNRRALLTSAAALCGLPVVAKTAPAAKPWTCCNKLVVGWRVEVSAASGAFMGFSGIDRAGFDRAREAAERCYPLANGNRHLETLTLDQQPNFTFLARVPSKA